MIKRDQAVHERRVADEGAGVRIAQRRPCRQRQQGEHNDGPQQRKQRVPQPRDSSAESLLSAGWPAATASLLAPLYLPSRGSIVLSVMNADEHRQEHDGRDREPEVRRQADGGVGIDQMDGVVGELDEDRVERLDQHVHGERAGNGGEAQGQAGERMAADAQERRACQRNQDQVAGVRRDARHDAHERQDVGQRPGRGDHDQLANQRLHQAGLLGHAGSHHGHDHEPDRGEAHEVRDQPFVHEANSVGRQQTLRGGRRCIEFVSLRIENLIADTYSQHMQDVGEHDDDGDEDQKDHRRVRDLVSHPLDHVEEFLHDALRSCDRLTHVAILLIDD